MSTKQQQPDATPQHPAQDTETRALVVREARPSPVATVADLQAIGKSIAESGMFGACTPGKGLVVWSICDQEGISLLEFLRTYHVTNDGKVSMRADRMMAEFLARGGKLVWTEYGVTRAAAKFSYGDNRDIAIDFTIDEAKRMGLIRSGSAWEKDPAAMLRARVITRGIRMVCPGVCAGVYTPEELDDARDDAPAPSQAAPARMVPQKSATAAPAAKPAATAAPRHTPTEQAAVATVVDALEGEIVDDDAAPESPMAAAPGQKPAAKPAPKAKPAAKPATADPKPMTPAPNYAVCPIPGKLYKVAWDEMEEKHLSYALTKLSHQLEPGHIAAIQALLEPAPDDTLPF